MTEPALLEIKFSSKAGDFSGTAKIYEPTLNALIAGKQQLSFQQSDLSVKHYKVNELRIVLARDWAGNWQDQPGYWNLVIEPA